MTVTIQLQDQTVEALASQAAARGLSLEEYLAELAKANDPQTQAISTADRVREFDEALDELFAADTHPLPPLPPGDTREEIYLDHD